MVHRIVTIGANRAVETDAERGGRGIRALRWARDAKPVAAAKWFALRAVMLQAKRTGARHGFVANDGLSTQNSIT